MRVGGTFLALAALASASASPLTAVRALFDQPEPPTEDGLRKAIGLLSDTTGLDPALAHAASEIGAAYSRRLELITAKPRSLAKLEKATAKAKAALASLEKDDWDDEEMLAAARKKAALAEAALSEAALAEAARAPRAALLGGLSGLVARHAAGGDASLRGAKLRVLSERPMIVVVDEWLGELGQSALANLTAVFEQHTSLEPDEGQMGGPGGGGRRPEACLPPGGDIRESLLGRASEAVAAAHRASEAREAHCEASASIAASVQADGAVSSAELSSLFGNGTDFGPGCGPLTKAIDEALTSSHVLGLDVSASLDVDLLDIHLAGARA